MGRRMGRQAGGGDGRDMESKSGISSGIVNDKG